MPETTPRETNSQRLQRAADILRRNAGDGQRSEFVAQMLEHCKLIADFWSEPYAAPFVPMLESALKLTGIILGDRPARIVAVPGMLAESERLLKMPVSGELLHDLLHLPPHIRVVDVVWTDRHDIFDFMVLVPDAPAGAVEFNPTFKRANGWPDPYHMCDVSYGFLPGLGEQPPATRAESWKHIGTTPDGGNAFVKPIPRPDATDAPPSDPNV